MATLSLFPSSFLSLPYYHRANQCWIQRRPPILIVCCASTRKSRASRKLISDTDLCKGLREFVSSVGLPEDHVPSMKELTEHGRKDLANIVRRRGYKAIKDLLSKYIEIANGSEIEDVINEENVPSDHEDDTAGQDKKVKDLNEESLDSTEGVSSYGNYLDLKIESDVCLDAKSLNPSGSRDASPLQEKVERFLKHGHLETVEDNISSDLWVDKAEGNGVYVESSCCSHSVKFAQRDPQGAAIEMNDYTVANATSVLSESAANPASGINQISDPPYEVPPDVNFDEDKKAESKIRNQVEVDRLKSLLHQKERELSRLKAEIEKEMKALSTLQAKAENEINKAQELISEKDAELLAAEESLSGLKEVQIQYMGEGETVEVSGSFNGWHQRIKMDPLAFSTNSDTTNSRNSRQWSITLWLYPGEYEIKFIVDGQWKIDPQRESTNRSGIENNILQVDRWC